MKTTFIYALCEPGTRTVRYIGKSKDPKKRLVSHLRYSSIKANTYLGRWLRNLVSLGGVPEMVILREVPHEKWEHFEMQYIRIANALKLRLVNGTKGGDGVRATPEVKEKLRVTKLGEKNPMFGKHHTEESKALLSAALSGENSRFFGVPKTEEEKSWLSELNSGENHPHFGKERPAETREKISRAKLDQHLHISEEARQAISGPKNHMFGKVGVLHHLFGTKRSEESIEKQRATRRANRLNKKGEE